jgi:predicted Zn-dependent protease
MDALTALVRMQAARGQREAAMARVRAVVAADTHNAIAHNLLGELMLAGGRSSPEATAEFDQAASLAPKWWVPYRNLALTRLASKDVAGGIAAYEAGVKATQFDLNLVTELASLYEQQQHIDAAIGLYESLQQRQPRLELAANNLAMLLVTYRQDQASMDRARDLTASFSQTDNGALLDTYGWVKLKRGEVDAALPALERAAAQSPESRVIRYHLGMVQFKAGQRDKARSSLEAALAGAPSFTGRDEARTLLAQLKGRAPVEATVRIPVPEQG